jgi:hypothetical protein
MRMTSSSARALQLFVILFLFPSLLVAFKGPGRSAGASAIQSASTSGIVISVESVGAIDTAGLESSLRPAIDTAASEISAVFEIEGDLAFSIVFGVAPDMATQKRWQSIADIAWVDPGAGKAIVSLDRFLTLSPIESGNVMRNLVARAAMHQATAGTLPAGINDGIAWYFERPVLAEQARRGSLVQQLDLAGEIPDLATLVNAAPSTIDDESATSLHYAFAAFIADHYGIASLQNLVASSRSAITWHVPLTTATGQSIEQITTAWDQFLPRWFSGGWQFNAFNGFDLSAAQGLFDRGAYTSAIALAEHSQSLFAEIDDPVRLAQVEAFISLSSIGVRAEQLMNDVQVSLEQRDYVQAQIKLNDAEEQYTYLPESHRPASLISTWRTMIGEGLVANENLASARALAGDWSQTREARNYAIAAGNGFAALGDTVRAEDSQELTSQLNQRLQRITLAAIGIVILVATWLLVWLWARAPRRFVWQDPRHLTARAGRSN